MFVLGEVALALEVFGAFEYPMLAHKSFAEKTFYVVYVKKGQINVSWKLFWSTRNCLFTHAIKVIFYFTTLRIQA
jgi:hypothetical protein